MNRNIIKMPLLFFGLVALFIFCSNSSNNPSLAKFRGGAVLQSDYIEHYLLSTQYKPTKFPTLENLQDIVSLKAMEKLAVFYGKERKIQDEAAYQEVVGKNENRILFHRYMREHIIDHIITDSLINKFYSEFTPQYKMAYIMRPFTETSTEKFITTQKDSIEIIYKFLKAGQKFEDLAKKYSQDISTNKKGGDLGFIIRESMGDAILRTVMDTLKVFHYSVPVKGFNGYYILFKGEKRDVPVPPFSQVKEKIWKTLYQTRRHEVRNLLNKKFDEIGKKYNFQIHEEAIEKIKQKAGAKPDIDDFTPLAFDSLTDAEMNLEVASYAQGSIKVLEIFADRKRSPIDMRDFRDRLFSIAQQYILGQEARELNMQQEAEMEQQIQQMKESILRTIVYEKEVKDKAFAIVDSLKIEKQKELSKTELKDFIQKKRFELERDFKTEFENKLKEKYKFKFIEDNFTKALEEARKQKDQQNEQRDKESKEEIST